MAVEHPTSSGRTIDDWIASRHCSGFVGRAAEMSVFDRALLRTSGPIVIYVYGPGGSGKTALLEAMHRRSREQGRETYWLGVDTRLPEPLDGSVLFVDDFERPGPANALREDLLRDLPANVVVVLSSRRRPGPGWRRSGWEQILWEIELAGLSAEESLTLLDRLGVSSASAEDIQPWAAGLPLSLVLAGMASMTRDALPDEAAVAAKVAAVVTEGELDARFHDALHVCAIARTTTLDLLNSVLRTDSRAAFDWLAERSFVEGIGGALAPHELVREPLRATFTSTAPEPDQQLRLRICDYYYRAAVAGSRPSFADLAHLVSSRTVQWGYRLDKNIRYWATSVRDGDAAAVGAGLRRRGYRDWWSLSHEYYRHPDATVVVARSRNGAPAGHAIGFVPATAPPELMASDPIGAECAAYAREINAASTTLVWRDTMILPAHKHRSADGDVCSLLNFSLAQRAELPHLRHALVLAFEQGGRVHKFCREIGGGLVPELRWMVDGRSVGCYHIDLGAGGLLSAQRDLVYRELQIAVPNQAATATDVRRALEAFTSDDVLENSPLAVGQTGPDRAESVRARLRSAADAALCLSPNAEQLSAIVERRFLIRSDAHDAIARSLPVSRATYFRRLNEAVDLITRHVLAQDA